MTYDVELLMCTECAKDIRLKKLIEKINKEGLCTCCENRGLIIDVDSNEFAQMIKALTRYHYSEWDYNTHWGGEGFLSLFTKDDNIFFNKEKFKNQEVFDQLIDRIDCFEVYEKFKEGVSIYAGYYDGEQNPLLQSIKSSIDYSINGVGEKLKTENYFKFEEQIIEMLAKYSESSKIKIDKSSEFYRARTGVENRKRSLLEGGFEGEMIFVPFANSKIGAPAPGTAGFGRLNRAGVSYLYCATDKYTAISEIRPHPGDVVSIGKFVVNSELEIFDLTESQFLNFYHSNETLQKFGKLNTFTELMQKVVPPSEREVYNITQLIADCIRKLNFDGILFPSSVGEGDNLVVFDPELLSYTDQDAEVVEIQAVSYEYFGRKCRKDISDIH